MRPPDSKPSKLETGTSKLDDLLDESDARLPTSGRGRSSRGRSRSRREDDFNLDDLEPPKTAGTGDGSPNPVELPSPINPEGGRKQSVETHRNLFCAHYDACLDEAVKRGWNSFTCVRCALYRVTPEQSEVDVDHVALQRR